MKRIFSVLILVLSTVVLLSACGREGGGAPPPSPANPNEAPVGITGIWYTHDNSGWSLDMASATNTAAYTASISGYVQNCSIPGCFNQLCGETAYTSFTGTEAGNTIAITNTGGPGVPSGWTASGYVVGGNTAAATMSWTVTATANANACIPAGTTSDTFYTTP